MSDPKKLYFDFASKIQAESDEWNKLFSSEYARLKRRDAADTKADRIRKIVATFPEPADAIANRQPIRKALAHQRGPCIYSKAAVLEPTEMIEFRVAKAEYGKTVFWAWTYNGVPILPWDVSDMDCGGEPLKGDVFMI